MGEDKVDYSEIICEAVDTIVSKKIENLGFDITKTCRVIDDTYKRQGRYTVTDNSINFEAYSAITTLNINDSVLVNIPYGDYNNQKTILNKIIYEDETIPLNYVSPLDNMLKFTKNILDDQLLHQNSSILANGTVKEKLLYSFNWDKYSGYDRMGFSAKFLTWLGRYNTISGIYGLKFIFVSNDNVNYELDFNVNDMTGNPYQFETYHKQEKLFDISKFANIKELNIYLYQLGDFIDTEGQPVPYEIEGDPILNTPITLINDNIYVNDIEIYLGYQLSEFDGDNLIISTPGYLSYSRIEELAEKDNENGYIKTLNLRWIHEETDGSYSVLTNDDIIKRNIHVYWFKYALNASQSADLKEIAGGPNWIQTGMNQNKTDQFICTFTPDLNRAEEKIKAVCTIIEDGITKKYSSSIITFYNEQSVIDSTTYDAATGLSIRCGDGTEGNYFIYNQSGEIINEGIGQGYIREFQLYYKGEKLENNNTIASSVTRITWRLPNDNTMLSYSEDYFNNSSKKEEKNGIITIVREPGKVLTSDFFIQNYSIKNYWHSVNATNTISCTVEINGNIYETSFDLSFGKAGTSGTNLTLVLNYSNNNNAFRILENINNECTIQASVYDMSGSKVSEIEGKDSSWEWQWYTKPDQDFITIKLDKEHPSRINLTLDKNYGSLITENYYVLQATYKREGSTPITSYLPIGLMKDGFSYAEGARKVIYNSQGKPDYYTDAYILYNSNGQVNATWSSEYPTYEDENGLTKPLYINHPILKTLVKDNNNYVALSANPVYIKDDDTRFCVYAQDNNGNIVYSQAILIMQSQYDYATLNNWNGSVEVGDQTIMTAMLGAGRKEENTFSGIVIGDLTANNTTTLGTSGTNTPILGIYGMNKGITTFSLLDSGTIALGKSGDTSGYLTLGDPEVGSLIQNKNGNFTIDIDEGYISINHTGSSEKLIISDKPTSISNGTGSYLSLTSNDGTQILNFKQNIYEIQSSDKALYINLNNGSITSTTSISCNTLSASTSISCNTLSVNDTIRGSSMSLSGSLTCNTISATSIKYNGQELSEYITSLIQSANP